jgi:hypothetical protein
MQQPLADTRSNHMTHSSPVPSAYARPTPAHALPGLGALSARIKAIIVDALALILAWNGCSPHSPNHIPSLSNRNF